jgi:cell division transport system ATP-binding protein
LTGHSGAGKSSILKLIALIERPTRGQVFINNQNTGDQAARHPAVPPRNSAWCSRITSCCTTGRGGQRRAAADHRRRARREIDKRVRAALDQVGLLGKEKSRPLELSTGEQQRVGIARAMVAKPTAAHRRRAHRQSRSGARARDHEAVQALQ